MKRLPDALHVRAVGPGLLEGLQVAVVVHLEPARRMQGRSDLLHVILTVWLSAAWMRKRVALLGWGLQGNVGSQHGCLLRFPSKQDRVSSRSRGAHQGRKEAPEIQRKQQVGRARPARQRAGGACAPPGAKPPMLAPSLAAESSVRC